jgi:hypothetical protein
MSYRLFAALSRWIGGRRCRRGGDGLRRVGFLRSSWSRGHDSPLPGVSLSNPTLAVARGLEGAAMT